MDYDFSLGTSTFNSTDITCVFRGGHTQCGLLKNEAGNDVGSMMLYFDLILSNNMPRQAVIEFLISKTPGSTRRPPQPDSVQSPTHNQAITASGTDRLVSEKPPPYIQHQSDMDAESCRDLVLRHSLTSTSEMRRPPMFTSIYAPVALR